MKRTIIATVVAALAFAGTAAAALEPWTFVDSATIADAGGQVQLPTGTITSIDVLIDVQGTADLSAITVNGKLEVPGAGPTAKSQCKKGGWRNFTSPKFKNQGQCVAWYEHHRTAHNGR